MAQPARACITLAVTVDGADIRTLEGLDRDPLMDVLKAAFEDKHGLQCGFCTPGMLISARDLIQRKPKLSEADIRIAMSGNLCRCTGYQGIVRSIALAAENWARPNCTHHRSRAMKIEKSFELKHPRATGLDPDERRPFRGAMSSRRLDRRKISARAATKAACRSRSGRWPRL